MNCQNLLENGQPCGDEGRACDECEASEAAFYSYLKGLPRYAVIDDPQSREELDQDLRDAGRGHLVRP